MKRRLLALGTALALVASPATAAFAEEHEDPPGDEEATPLEQLAEAIGDWAEALVTGRDAVEGDEVDEGTQDEFDTLVGALEEALTDLFANLYFSEVEEQALEEVAELEELDEDEADETHGEAVSTVAQCAPRGTFKALVDGMANHGEYVTAAAHGETVGLTVPTIETGEDGEIAVSAPEDGTEPTEFDLSTVEGAEALCDALDVVYQARLLQLEVEWEDVDGSRDARVLAREQCKIERLRSRNGGSEADPNEVCAELRQRVRDEHQAERDAAREAREEAKAERAAERDERKAERAEVREQRKAERVEQGGGKGNKGKPSGD